MSDLKGSKLYLQNYMKCNSNKLSELILSASPSLVAFSEDINSIEWKSPLVSEDFYEYRDDFLEVLNLDKDFIDIANSKLKDFWPKNGPQWDGLAIVKNKNEESGVLLVEAKAHINETNSTLKATSKESIKKIKESIGISQKYYNIKPNDWTNNTYQLGNRIAYLYFMNIILDIPTWLVLINFIDGEYKPTTIEQWINHYNNIYKQMDIKYSNDILLNKIIHIFPKGI